MLAIFFFSYFLFFRERKRKSKKVESGSSDLRTTAIVRMLLVLVLCYILFNYKKLESFCCYILCFIKLKMVLTIVVERMEGGKTTSIEKEPNYIEKRSTSNPV